MSSYDQAWQPGSLAEATYLIDTARDGEEFWQQGELDAVEAMAHAPTDARVVVDYGCGVGRSIGTVNTPVTIGVDVSPQMLALAQLRFPDTLFLRCDGRSIPLPSGYACFIYSNLVLQHMDVQDVDAVVHDVGRVLRSGGRCYLRFSAFGQGWRPDATLSRGPLHWTGRRTGSFSPAHGTIAWPREIIETRATEAGLEVNQIQHVVLDPYHHDHALIATKP